MIREQTCDVCKYWVFDPIMEIGACHRNPPYPGGWPKTLPDDWCGEFMFKEPKDGDDA